MEIGITRGTMGPGDGSGRTVVEAGILTFLHIRELSTTSSLFLSGRGSAVGRLEHGFCLSDMYDVEACLIRFVCLLTQELGN